MPAKRRLHSFWIDPPLMDGLKFIRERDGVLPSEQIRRAIALWLERQGVPTGKSGGPAAKPRAVKPKGGRRG